MTEQQPPEVQKNTQVPEPYEYRGSYRALKIQPSAVTIDDLRKLYTRLSEKTSEALESYLVSRHPHPERDHQKLEAFKENIRRIGKLTIVIIGANGEQVVDSRVEALSPDTLPDKIMTITFDSAITLKNLNIGVLNSFVLHLDFTEPPGFHAYNPWNQPTPNNSNLVVSGPNTTWVGGVLEEIQSFFKERKRARAWLHSQTTFNVLNWLFAFPASLWIAHRVSSIFEAGFQSLHVTLKGALYIYLVLLGLLTFRVIIGGFRWIFPVVELQGARSKKVRTLLGVIFSSLILALLYDVLKTIF